MKIELIGEVADYYGEQNPDLAPLPKKGVVLSATEDELLAVRFPRMQGELALVPSEIVCNAAKLHGVMEVVHRIAYDAKSDFDVFAGIEKINRISADALAAPPRNCDRFADELDAQLAFLNEVWLISIDRETMTEQDTYEKWTDEMRTRYGRWLFALATERKGESDGK